MKFKLKAFVLVILLVLLAVPVAACTSPYDSINISLSTSISAIDNSGSVTLRRKRADANNIDANKFTITANVSAKKGVPTNLEVTSSKAEIVTILDVEYNEETGRTIVYCEANNAGEAQIKFVSFGGKSKVLRVNVDEPLRSITVDPTYTPYIYRGTTLQFDQTKIRYNYDASGVLLNGAVEPNVENRQIEYSVNEAGVSVNRGGLINVSSSFSKSSFNLYIKAASGATIDESGVATYAKTINVVDRPTVTRNNILIDRVSGVSTVDPIYQVDLQNNVALIDLALFRTDYEHKSAEVTISGYKIGNSNQIPATTFYYEEVNEYGAPTESGNVSITLNEYNNANFRITAGERGGVNAYINVYASLKGNEATKILIAKINVYIEDMPSNIILREVDGFYDDAGTIRPSLGDAIDNYLTVYNTGVKNIYPQIISGTQFDEDARVYVVVSHALMQYVSIYGATVDTTKETLTTRTYVVANKNEFGFSINSRVSLSDIGSLSENDKQVVFYAAKDYALPQETTTEYEFKRTSKTIMLEPTLTIDEVKLWVDAGKNTQDVNNIEFLDDSDVGLFIKPNAAENIALQMAVNRNDDDETYLSEVVVSFVPFLNGEEFNEYSANSFKFVCYDVDGNIVSDTIANSIFSVNSTNKTITIKPNNTVVGEYWLRVDGFGIDASTHFIKVNFYAKPYSVYLTLNGNRVDQHNMQIDNQIVLGVEAKLRTDNREEVLTLADLTIKSIELSEFNGQAVGDNDGVNTNWYNVVNGQYVQFNSRFADSGTYLFRATVIDGGKHEHVINLTIVVYKPLVSTDVFVKASGNGNEAIISNYNTDSLTENFYTTSTTYFADHQSRVYELKLNGVADINSYLSSNSAYVLSYLNDNEILIGDKTKLEVPPLASEGRQTVKFVIKQIEQADITIEININYSNAVQATSLSQYNGLTYIGKEEGYKLYKTVSSGIIRDFEIRLDSFITANATDKRIGYFLDEGASRVATVNQNGVISFKVESGKNIAGEGYLYVYAFDALNDVLNKNIDDNGVITGNLVAEDFNNCSNYIKIKIIVADGENTGIVISNETDLKNIANTSLKYQLASNIKFENNATTIAGFSGELDGNGYVIYGVNLTGGAKLFTSGTVKNLLISYTDGRSEIYLADGTLAGSALTSVNSISVVKNELDFTTYKPVDLSELFEFDYEGDNTPTLKYSLTYANSSSNDAGVVVGNFAVIEYAGAAVVTVSDASGKTESVNVTFNYAGSIPASAKRSKDELNFETRKNFGVNIGKVNVESPYKVETSVIAFSGELNGATLDSVTMLDSSGRFSASLAGVYTISERIVLDGFGVVCENLITVNVYEGPTNISVNILNKNIGVNEPSAQIAPFETLVVKVRVTTDNLNSVGIKLVLDAANAEKINDFSYSYITETGTDSTDVRGFYYKEYTYYISVKESAQASILGSGIWFNFVILDGENETGLNSTIFVSYVKTLPNYVEFYNFKSSNQALTNSELAKLTSEASTSEIEPEFVYNKNSIGGYQTFVFDVFPNYVAGSDLKITTKSVENLNNEFAPLPQVVVDNAKYEFNTQKAASVGELENGEVRFNNGEAGHLYYVVKVYVPLRRTDGDNVYQTEMGDKYKFTFTVSLGKESYDISRTLEVVYPLYLTGLFVEAGSEEKTYTSSNGESGDLRDEVAIGTNFYMLFDIVDPSEATGSATIGYNYDDNATSTISAPNISTSASGKQRFSFDLSSDEKLLNINGENVTIKEEFNKIYIYFTATKIYNGRTLKSNTLKVEINPVLYKVKNVDIYKVDESNDNGLLSLSNAKNASLAVTANHIIKLAAVTENATQESLIANSALGEEKGKLVYDAITKSIEELNENLNKTKSTEKTTYYPYLYYNRNGQGKGELGFTLTNGDSAQNAKAIPTWTTTNYTYKVNYIDDTKDPSIIFGLTTTENTTFKLESNVTLQINGGVYSVDDGQNNELVKHEYGNSAELSLHLKSTSDAPYPVANFLELASFVSRSENDESFADTALILTQDIVIEKEHIESLGLNNSAATTFAANFASLDGNGYTIYFKEGVLDWLITNYNAGSSSAGTEEGSTSTTNSNANVGLFTSIGANTIIKNVNIDFSYGGTTGAKTWTLKAQANAELANSELNFNFGFLAGVNNGIITNCTVRIGGLVTIYPFAFARGTQANITANIGGLVGVNNGYITNSTVGGFDYAVDEETYVRTETPITSPTELIVGGTYDENYNDYVSNGNFMLGGFVGKNTGKIASSKFANTNLINGAESQPNIATAGFAVENTGSIKYSYAEGYTASGERSESYLKSSTIVAGFVYTNLGYVGDCYSNYTLNGGLGVAGFAQTNGSATDETVNATIESSLSTSEIVSHAKLGFRPFIGTTVNTSETQTSNNFGTINNCYYLVFEDAEDTIIVNGVTKLNPNELNDPTSLTGFAFSLNDSNDSVDGVWKMGNRSASPTLVAANITTYAHRVLEYVVNRDTEDEFYFYSEARGAALGSDHNPVIVYDVETFNKIADEGNNGDSYRLICDIEFDATSANTIKTTKTTFTGKLDGNGMSITNVYINLREQEANSIGLFANLTGTTKGTTLRKAEVKALDVEVTELYASQVAAVGVVAGIVSDANIYNVNVSSSSGRVVHGKNAAGGVAGFVIGNSQIYNCTSSIDVLSTWSGSDVTIDEIGFENSTSELLGAWNTDDTFDKLNNNNDSDASTIIANGIKEVSYAGGVVGAYAGTVEDDFTPMLSVLHAQNIRVEGGVVGGVIGGVLTADALATDLEYTTDLTRGKLKGRIAAGGVVGENRGRIMFAVSKHTKEVQEEIDAVDDSGNLTNILDVTKYNNNVFDTQKVYAVGGIVGINIGGDISQGYSRINIDNPKATYAGGVVGVSNQTTLSNIYTTSGVYGVGATGGIVGYMPDKTLTLESVVAINLYTPSQQRLVESTNRGSVVGLIAEDINAASAIKYREGTAGTGITATKTSTITPYFYNFSGENAGEVSTTYNSLPLLTGKGSNETTIANNDDFKNNVLQLDNTPENEKIEMPNPEKPDETTKVGYTLKNSLLILDRDENKSKTRKGVFAAFYNDVNNVWETYENAYLNKTGLPKIISFKNYRSTTINIPNTDAFIAFIKNCNEQGGHYLRSNVVITDNIDLTAAGVETKLATVRYNSNTLIGKPNSSDKWFNGSLTQQAGTTLNLGSYTLFEQAGSAIFNDLNVVATANNPVTIEKDSKPASVNSYGAIARKAEVITFTNCKLKVTGSTSATNVGGFVGEATTNAGFNGCTLTEFSIIANSATHVGGFVGNVATIMSMRNANVTTLSITSNAQNVGGLIGYAEKINGAATITLAENASTITVNNESSANVGGVVGYVNGVGAIDNATIKNLTINSNSSCNLNAGMIGGATTQTRYTNCYALGGSLTVNSTYTTTTGDYYAAGLAASATSARNCYSLATITVSSANNAQVAGLVGFIARGGTVDESFYSGAINGGTNTNAAGLVYKNLGTINKCFTNNLDVTEAEDETLVGSVSNATTGANVSGLVYANGGTLQHSYSTMRLGSTGTSTAFGLVAINRTIGTNDATYNGIVSNCYFAGRNMVATTRVPILKAITRDNKLVPEYGTVTNVVYAKNLGFDSVNNSAGSGKTISEMLNFGGLAQVDGEGNVIYYNTYNDQKTFPLLSQTTSSNAFTNYQVCNVDVVPKYISAINEDEIKEPSGFYVLNTTTDGSVLKLENQTYTADFTGVLASSTNQVITLQNTLFNKISGATIFGLTIQGEDGANIDGLAAIAKEAENSVIANCSLDNTSITSSQNESVGGFVSVATNTDFYNSYVGENVTLSSVGNVGGLAASASGGSFNNCYFAGTIESGASMAGIYNIGSAKIKNCYVSGNLLNVSGTTNKSANAFTRASNVRAENSYSIAYIQSQNTSIRSASISVSNEGEYSNTWINTYKVSDSNGTTEKTSAFPMLNGLAGQEEGTRVNPIKISSYTDLQNIERDSKKAYILTGNIAGNNMLKYNHNFAEEGVTFTSFEPIYNFGGTFYGNGYTISNLLVTNKKAGETTNGTNRAYSYDGNTPNYGDALGMFSTTNGAYLFDVKLQNAEMYASNVRHGAGFIVGASLNVKAGEDLKTTYLSNCSATNSMMFAGRYETQTTDNNPELKKGTTVNDIIGGSFANYYSGAATSNGNEVRVFNNSSSALEYGTTARISAITEPGKSNGVYQIDTAGKFIWWAKNGKTTSAVLTANINLSGYRFNRMENKVEILASVLGDFSATLDGNGHYITGFTCNTFIQTLNGTVQNLNLFNVSVETDTTNSAGIIAITNNGNILNCLTSGISGLGRQNSGSICSANNGNITNSFGAGCNITPNVLNEYALKNGSTN